MKIRSVILLVILINAFIVNKTQAQSVIKILVIDDSNAKISGVNAELIKVVDSTILGHTVSDGNGEIIFKIPSQSGLFFIKFSAIGYKKLVTSIFKLDHNNLILPTAELEFSNKLLKELNVNAKRLKPIFERDAEKLTINVEHLNVGNNSYDLLNNSPGIIYGNAGNISLNGRPGTRVMVDGKYLYLTGNDLDNYLRSLNLSLIQKVEIISNPSAKYDAEGTGGLINIILKTAVNYGISGNITSSFTQGRYAKFSESLSINYKQKKLTIGLNYSYSKNTSYEQADYNRLLQTTLKSSQFNQNIYSKIMGTGNLLNLSADYDFNKKKSIGFNIKSNIYSENIPQSNRNQISTNQLIDSILTSNNNTINKLTNTSININYISKLDTAGALFSLNFDKTFYSNTAQYYYNILYYNNIEQEAYNALNFSSRIPNRISPMSFRIDFTLPVNKTSTIETGAKLAFTNANNNIDYQSSNNLLPIEIDNSKFKYDENIQALYVNYRKAIGKFRFSSGLRGEMTYGKGITNNSVSFSKHYLNLFPTLFSNYKVNENNSISLALGRRIQRPNYRDLNPFTYLIDPYYYLQGNSGLKPQFSNYGELSYTVMKKYIVTAILSNTADLIMQIPKVNTALSTTTLVKENIGSYNNMGLTAYIPIKIKSWWANYLNLQYYYKKYETAVYPDVYINSGSSFRASISSNLTLPKMFIFDINGYYQSSAVQGVYKTDSYSNLNLGIKKSIGNFDIRILWTDVLSTYKMRNLYNVADQTIDLHQYFDSKSIGITASYKFKVGNSLKNDKRNINTEEQQRL